MRFEGTSEYVATDDLKVAVNAAVLLRREFWSHSREVLISGPGACILPPR